MNEKTDKKPESNLVMKDAVKAKEADVKAAVGAKAEEVKAAVTKAGAKVEAKAEEAKTAVTKAVEKTEEKAEAVKEAVKEEKPVKKAAPKRKAGRKAAEKKNENETEIFVEFEGTQSSIEDVRKRVIDAFVAEGHRASTIKTLRLYLKPVDYAAYYVINDKFMGRVDLF